VANEPTACRATKSSGRPESRGFRCMFTYPINSRNQHLKLYGHLFKEVNSEQAEKLDAILGFGEQPGNPVVGFHEN
jgi:hypothetical protein